jgi:hypothetical protein
MRIKPNPISAAALIMAAALGWGTAPQKAAAQEAAPAAPAGEVWRVRSIRYNIQGRTREDMLAAYGAFAAGLVFPSEAAVAAYAAEKTELLRNNRVFSTAAVAYTAGEPRDGERPVDLDVSVVDTHNFVVLPYPKYDSNTGFLFRLRAYDNNFLGGMSLLKADAGYTYTKSSPSSGYRHHALALLDGSVPFSAFGLLWNVQAYSKTLFAVAGAPDVNTDNTLDLSARFALGDTVLTLGFAEGFTAAPLGETREIEWQDSVFTSDNLVDSAAYQPLPPDGRERLYFSSRPYVKWKIVSDWKLPVQEGALVIPFGAAPEYEAHAAGGIKYSPNGTLAKPERGFELALRHRLGFAAVAWNGNFRNGTLMYIQNENIYNFEYDSINSSVAFVFTRHQKIAGFFGVSFRFRCKQWFMPEEELVFQSAAEAGSVLRGVPDKLLRANTAFSLNADFPFRLFMFMPSLWFAKPKLRYFNFELHVSPVLDIALVEGTLYSQRLTPLKDISLDFQNIIVCGGFEFLVFPLSWRSLFVRLSVAFNLKGAATTDEQPPPLSPEIFFGIGQLY